MKSEGGKKLQPLVIRSKTTPKTALKCIDCMDTARAVWLDPNGTTATLCDACVDKREKEYLRDHKNNHQIGA